jgi:hypothetical protein
MTILFLHGWHSTPGGIKPTYLKDHGHEVLNPALPDDDFETAVRTAQAEFDRHHPDVVVGSSRGGAVAMNIQTGSTPLVLLCPAWKHWGTARAVKPGTAILHARADETVPFSDSVELLRNSGLPSESLIEVGTEHRLADPESLAKMAEAVEWAGSIPVSDTRLISTTNRRSSWLKAVLITLVVAYLVVQLTVSGIRFVHDRQVEGQAKQWFTQAQEDAKPTWSEDDAVRWLKEHGIPPYRGEQSGSGGRHLIVDGYEQIEEGGLVTRPASVHMTFLLDLDHKFERVEYDLWPFEPPGRKRR